MKDALQPLFAVLRARGFFRKNGQTLVEYALVLAVMTVALIIATAFVTGRVRILFSLVDTILDNADDTSAN